MQRDTPVLVVAKKQLPNPSAAACGPLVAAEETFFQVKYFGAVLFLSDCSGSSGEVIVTEDIGQHKIVFLQV